MLADQAVQISVNAGHLTGTVVQFALQQFMYRRFLGVNREGIVHGEQTLEQLNAQGREMKHVEIHEEDLQAVRDALKHYGVDFHIMQNPDSDVYYLFFKAQDIDRVHMGIEQYVKDLNREPMEEQMKDAVQEAQERNDAREAAQELEHVVEKAVQQEAAL